MKRNVILYGLAALISFASCTSEKKEKEERKGRKRRKKVPITTDPSITSLLRLSIIETTRVPFPILNRARR